MKRLQRNWARILLWIISALLFLPLLLNAWVVLSVSDKLISAGEAAVKETDCILVLGAGVQENGAPSAMLEDRLATGYSIWAKNPSMPILLSGDHGQKEYDEVNAMKRYMLEKGVPEQMLFLDHAGFSTYESMYRARDIFQVKRVIVVTQEYHLSRAVYIARALGLEAYGVRADLREYQNKIYNDTREALARVKDFFCCLFQPDPTYLGDAIPIWSDGRYTNG